MDLLTNDSNLGCVYFKLAEFRHRPVSVDNYGATMLLIQANELGEYLYNK